MKKIIAAALLMVLAISTQALAFPPAPPFRGPAPGPFRPAVRPWPRPHLGPGPAMPFPARHDYWRDHNDGWKNVAIGAGIGLLLGAIANGSASSGSGATAAQEQQAMQNEAVNQTRYLVQLIGRQGASGALSTISGYWQGQGQNAAVSSGMPISICTVTGFSQPSLSITYTVNTATETASVTVANPADSLSGYDSSSYTLPDDLNPFLPNVTQTAY